MSKTNHKNQPKTGSFTAVEAHNHYECAHCGSLFIPKKRFVQKYCSESCRVMACKERKRLGTSARNVALQGSASPKASARHQKPTASAPKAPNNFQELLTILEQREKKMMKKMEDIHQRQTYHMIISAIVPFFAEPLRQKLVALNAGKQKPQDMNQLMEQMKPFLKALPADLQAQLTQASVDYWSKGDGKLAKAL